MPEIAQTNHHNTQVDELLSRPPGWLLRWGSTVALFALFTLFAIAWFVRYPDVVTGTANISQVNPPQVLQARQNGRLAQLLVADGANVQKGSVLAVLENAAQLNDVQEIDSLTNCLSAKLIVGDTILEPILWPVKALGDLQNNYTLLQASYTQYVQFLHQRVYQQKIAAMQSQLAMYHQFYQRSWQQRLVLQEQFDLAQARFVSDSILGLEGVYSKQDVSQRKENMLQLEYSLHGARAALAQTQIQVAELEKNSADLQLEFMREKTNKRQAAEQSLKALQNGVKSWFLQNAFVAEIKGVVNYQTLWAKNQNVLGGQHVFTIIPKQKSETKAVVLVPPARASKIITGARVQIKLDAYPYEEYGMLVGTLAKINSSPTALADGTLAYVVEVSFVLPLETSYGKSIAEMAEQSGTAEIITEELSLLARIFYSLRKIFAG